MEYGLFDFLKLVGSLALFLYGMKIMSDGLQKLAGNKLRNVLSAMTRNRVMGVLTGVLISAVIQSSSATTVMVVSFVNAGLLSLVQSIGVIMGANIGTTVTAWVISLFGFGKFSISALSIPLMGLAIPFIFSSKSKNKSFGEFVFGFAFLFMGLDFLKDSMPDLQNNPEVLGFVRNFSDNGFLSVLFFLLIGTVLTIIVQSSSATVALTLIMTAKGWIDFPSAAAMVMGENIGTTITANLAAIPANISAKRAAFSHLMFNVLGVVWMLFVFKYFIQMVGGLVENATAVNPNGMTAFLASLSPQEYATITATNSSSAIAPELADKYKLYLEYQTSTSYGLSLFHTLFNVFNVSIMIWFVKVYEKICLFVIKPRKGTEDDEEFVLKYIGTGMSSSSELSILQVEQEVGVYANRVKRMLDFIREMTNMASNDKEFLKLYNRVEKYEEISDRMEVEIGNYVAKVSEGRLSNESKETTRAILRIVTEIESIADAACNIGRHLNRKSESGVSFDKSLIDNINSMYDLIDKAFENMIVILQNRKVSGPHLIESTSLEKEINDLRSLLKKQNVVNVDQMAYSYQSGVLYMDIINECEHLGDYIINVVDAMKAEKTS